MYRFTTPTITLRMPSTVSAGNITSLVVTIAQESVKVEKELADVVISRDANTITFRMTQQETGGFAKGQAKIQTHFRTGDDVFATTEKRLNVYDNLHGEVLT